MEQFSMVLFVYYIEHFVYPKLFTILNIYFILTVLLKALAGNGIKVLSVGPLGLL